MRMRFLHTSDWHIGKKLNGYDLLADQKAMINQLLALAKSEKVDALVIAGDIYDRSVPPETAVSLYNEMIKKINLEAKLPILAISGNHDSSTRLGAGTSWFEATNYFLRTELAESFEPVEIGDTQFFLLPYFEPFDAQLEFGEKASIKTIQDAMPHVLQKMQTAFAADKKHVLVTHFFVAGSTRLDSETKVEVGGLASIPTDLLAIFDYTALGHLHGKDAIHLPKARYSGSLLKYSLSEINQPKGAWLVDWSKKEWLTFKELTPKRDIKKVTASFNELLSPNEELKTLQDQFLHVELTDQAIIPGLMNELRQIYPYILSIERINGRTKQIQTIKHHDIKQVNPEELIQEFFTDVTGESVSQTQEKMIQEGIQAVQKESDS